ncbi:hypothetical protein [Ruegeria lacuscaerulensis]|nr:hypothetical protein [Ruegeria lacuscaerulensis]
MVSLPDALTQLLASGEAKPEPYGNGSIEYADEKRSGSNATVCP